MNGSAVPPPVTGVLDAAPGWLPARMATVERRLGELAVGHGGPLGAEASATLGAGGKRLRPMLVLLCAGPAGGEQALRAATAVELVHEATLVHDDVLDSASLRRGSATVVSRAGRGLATAVGDLLFSRAFAELASELQVAALARAAVALARGELAQRSDAYRVSLSADRYLERCRLKTASLFECACVIGLGAEAPGAEGAMARFGREVGIAFQQLDDVLDVAGPPQRTGKARGTDLLDGTVTLPLILARSRDPVLTAIDLRDLDPATAELACERIAATGVLEEVRADARARVERAKQELQGAPLEPGRRELLELVADGVVERYA